MSSASAPASGFALAQGDYGEFEGAERDRVVFGTYRASGTWSPALVSLLADELLRGGEGTLLDVGANIGLIAIAIAERSRARCLAFEPEPTNFALLARNVARHGLAQRVELHPVALAAQRGEAMLALCEDNSGDHRLLARAPHPGERCIPVRTERLDDVLAGRELPRPWLMKLDTQGAEVRVLRGASATLSQLDALVVEYWPAGLARMGDSAEALAALLSEFRYAALLDQHTARPPLYTTPDLLRALASLSADRSDEGFFDLVLLR